LLLIEVVGCNLFAPPPDNTIPDTVPDFEAATFTNPALIDNPYFPQPLGVTRTYEGGGEVIVIDVLDDQKQVMGIAVRVVRDRVFVDDVLVEDTHDWFAQDDEGNVWYMGEEVDNYNYDDQGELIDITHEGAWEAGKDVAGIGVIARPGHVMKAMPMVGDVYSQEYYVGEAEDMGEVVALNVAITMADGTQYTTLQTRDFTPLEPGVNEYKYYAAAVGMVREEVVGGDEQINLVSVDWP
jgi:hypothetical protein